jgi:protein-tyrosine phosphatase
VRHTGVSPAKRLLFVCTGNICRSPMAEALLADELARRHIDATVHSAGLLDDGRPASPHSVRLMADRGLDITRHASRAMTPTMLEQADLIIGMERQHVREAAVLVPAAWPRAFTLPELARRVTAAGPRPPAVALADWLPTLIEGRTIADHLGSFSPDEVADPIGRTLRVSRKCAEELDELIGVVVDRLWPATGPRPHDALRSTTA